MFAAPSAQGCSPAPRPHCCEQVRAVRSRLDYLMCGGCEVMDKLEDSVVPGSDPSLFADAMQEGYSTPECGPRSDTEHAECWS